MTGRSQTSGTLSVQRYNHERQLVKTGKASWFRRYKTLDEINRDDPDSSVSSLVSTNTL